MKKRMICVCLMFVLLCLSIVSCGPAYRTDVPSARLTGDVLSSSAPLATGDAYREVSDNYKNMYFDKWNDTAVVKEYSVVQSESATDFNEAGAVVAVDEAHAEQVRQMVEDYLSLMHDYYADFLSSYNAVEVEKIESAECRVYGRTVVYAFLTRAEQKTYFAAVESTLKSGS